MTRAITLAANQKEVDPMWILCDSESTVDIFRNKNILTNIRTAEKPIQLKGIGGKKGIRVNQEGELMGYGTVYYHPKVAAMVISFFNLTKKFDSVVYDNQKKDQFHCDKERWITLGIHTIAGRIILL